MQKNKKEKKSTMGKMAPYMLVAGIVATGTGIVYYTANGGPWDLHWPSMPLDYDHDGTIETYEIVSGSLFGPGGGLIGAGMLMKNPRKKNKGKVKVKSKADSYGHVRAV